MASFLDADKSRIRYHLEYPNIERVANVVDSVVLYNPVMTKLETMMNNVTTDAIAQVLKILTILDGIETQLVDANTRLQAAKADVVTMNANEHVSLLETYAYWQSRVCKILDVEVNPFANKGQTMSINFSRGAY